MSVPVKQFHSYIVHISDDVKDGNAKRYHACTVPVQLKPLHYANDPPYLKGDRTSQMVQAENGRK